MLSVTDGAVPERSKRNGGEKAEQRCEANDGTAFVVNVSILTVAPDFDGDGDVDQADFGHLQECFTHPGTAQNDPDCLDARLDDDDDVDLGDFGKFQDCVSGAGVKADKTCDD